jgi:hypothetical protein
MGIYSEFTAEFEDVFIQGDGQYDLEVVGESLYQKYLKALSDSCKKNGDRKELLAKLHYENANPHDKKAIRVVINGGTVGYLSPKNARAFRKRVEKVGMEGLIISCNAEIVGGRRVGLLRRTDYGVWLDLPLKNL